MTKTTNCSDNAAKGMAEAREVLEQVAGLIDAEWKRFLDSIESAPIPEPVKTALSQADAAFDNVRREAKDSTDDWTTDVSNALDELRDLVSQWAPVVAENSRRAARQFGVPFDNWPWDDRAGDDRSDDADTEDAVEPQAEKAKAKAKTSTAKKSTKTKSAKAKTSTAKKKPAKKSTKAKSAKAKASTAKKKPAKKSTKKTDG